MNPNQPGGNYPGNRPFDPALGRPFGPPPQAYPQAPQPYPVAQPYGRQGMQPLHPYMQQKPFSAKAIVSMVLGGVGFFMCPIGAITGVVGTVLGFLAMRDSKEPEGTHRGYGLAVGGLITNALVFLASLVTIGLIAWVYVEVEEEQQREATYFSNYSAEQDFRLIAERLQLYAIENGNSLEAGGPVVSDGWNSSYGEDAERVQGRLNLGDLVREVELNNLLSDYTLQVTSRQAATVRHTATGAKLTVTNAAKNEWHIEEGSTR